MQEQWRELLWVKTVDSDFNLSPLTWFRVPILTSSFKVFKHHSPAPLCGLGLYVSFILQCVFPFLIKSASHDIDDNLLKITTIVNSLILELQE